MSKAALLEAWRDHLAQARRRSSHTVRAYLAAAGRLIDATGAQDWIALARLDTTALRTQLAATADAAALAAASELPDGKKARAKAKDYAEKNMPRAENGNGADARRRSRTRSDCRS